MNTEYSIKNFRVFDKNGVTVPIKPLTILTGCNSSGKSSVVKSMVLLDSYLNEIRQNYTDNNTVDLKKYKLDFSGRERNTLGGFDRVLHRGSKDKYMEFSYVVHSLLLGEDVKVTFRFGTVPNDDLNDGHILGVSIEDLTGCIIFKSIIGEHTEGNLNIIRNSFFRYVWGQYLVWELRDDKRSPDNQFMNISDPDEDGKMAPFYKEFGEAAIDHYCPVKVD